MTEKLSTARGEDDFVETDLKMWSDRIYELRTDVSASIPIFFENIDDGLIQLAPYCCTRLIELRKTTETFGFNVVGGRDQNIPCYVSAITPNGAAWNHGGLNVGDQVLFVNDISVENEYHEKIIDLFKQAQGRVTFVVRYSPESFVRIKK